jgi:ABC-type nickel/cobalt efflux system permease component RcnA
VLTSTSVLLFGFVLGMRHALDPDHVVAVATIVSRERRVGAAALIGALWGVGHTLTVVVAGGAIVLFGIVVPPRVGLALELGVALMLVGLGAHTLATIAHRSRFPGPHDHLHSHGVHVHSHPHAHGLAHTHHALGGLRRPLEALAERVGRRQALRPLVVGVVHGLAGSAAVALLVLATIPEPVAALGYLVVFGLGTIVGMLLVTAVNAVPFAYTAARSTRANRYLGVASGLLSVGVGCFLAYRIGFVDGLFRLP